MSVKRISTKSPASGAMMKTGLLILGNQLFDPEIIKKCVPPGTQVFMREDVELCTYYKFHKHKIIFFLGAMRAFASEMEQSGFAVHYENLKRSPDCYESHLQKWLGKEKLKKIFLFEIEDKFFEKRIVQMLKDADIEFETLTSPMFLTTRSEFETQLGQKKKPFMKTFYEWQRKRLKILIDSKQQPIGGAWSLDEDNRLALPKTIIPPDVVKPFAASREVQDVKKVVDLNFADHPGQSDNFWLPTDRKGARAWLARFLKERLAEFGPYEDAISPHSDFVFHSVVSPFLNTGLLTPKEVVAAALKEAQKQEIPLNSIEGFVRQIIGWREFIRGIYQNFSERQETTNFWNHTKKLAPCWYDGSTGIAPLDHAIKKTVTFAYAHHIERLMVIGSMMVLLEVEPHDAHRWFMEMFVDSSDWVMGPNVYGMALFSDGGIFATKPYLCGSNYYRKMGGYKQDQWCDGVDGLYWGFIEKHKTFFMKNPRLSMMARSVEKMDQAKKDRIYGAADILRSKLVTSNKTS